MAAPVPRDSATVVIVRDAATPGGGIEVLLLQRAEGGDHNSGAWVFPGGRLDPGDRAAFELPLALTDLEASTRLSLPHGGLAYYLAAIRESFEEAGILFAFDRSGAEAALPAETLRDDVRHGRTSLPDVCRRFQLRLVPERLHYIAHWLTPLGRAKRFDTRFFLAAAPQRQAAMHDAIETTDHVWISPADALSAANARRLMVPTRAVLAMLLPFRDTAGLLRWAAEPRQVPRMQPRLARGAAGLESLPPGHPAYEEIGKLDPEGRCDAWCELRPGVPVRISPHILRTTGPGGRHTYRIGDDAQGWEDLPAGAVHLVPTDRVLIAPDAASAPPHLREGADWLAPVQGFLQPLRAR